ncbi:peptide chain release factor N(5)-glutamine methyltransferase [Martelella radicis]|nr:peptide chain release factor N(5)-glutamine methyltransferase [Martelella radicis]
MRLSPIIRLASSPSWALRPAEGVDVATLQGLYRKAAAAFETAGLETPAEDARHLVSGVLGLSLTEMMTEGARQMDADEEAAVAAAVERRLAREPVYRILGAREFYGLDFMLSADTLEPRPDTEILVESALPWLDAAAKRKGKVRLIDLGTGTGAIAIALLKNCAQARALATDIADGALETARANALINGVADRLDTVCGTWFSAVRGKFDMIVSNPPYIVSDLIETLAPEVKDHDPALALDGGKDGLDAYRAIAAKTGDHLAEDGVIALEIGFDQKDAVTAIFSEKGFALAQSHKDLGGNDRVVIFTSARKS